MLSTGELLGMIDSGTVRVVLVHGFPEEVGGLTVKVKGRDRLDVWLNADDSEGEILQAFKHELWHVGCGDLDSLESAEDRAIIEDIAYTAQRNDFYGYFGEADLQPYLNSARIVTVDFEKKGALKP